MFIKYGSGYGEIDFAEKWQVAGICILIWDKHFNLFY